MIQSEYISNLCSENPDAVIIGSLGTISYDLSEIEHPNKILIKGAMGAALGCGLGYALSSNKQVIVLIGEGSLLMQLGSISTIAEHDLPNLRVVVLDNDCYKSCGGQSNNFEAIAEIIPFEIVDISI